MCKVSVIVPFYQGIVWLEEAIDSVLDQTFLNYEIIIVNDGSPENDEGFIAKYGEVVKYFKTENKGAAHARNLGIAKAKGEYLAFLDSDDRWDKSKLEAQISIMESNNIIWSHTNYRYFNNETGEIIRESDLKEFDGNIFPKSLLRCHIATPSVVIRRDFMEKNNLRFEESMRTSQDYFLWLRLSQKTPLHLVSEAFVDVRHRGKNTATQARAHIRMRAQIWRLLRGTTIFSGIPYSRMVRYLYRLCFYQNVVLEKYEDRFGPRHIEPLSKTLYFLPYIGFLILYRIYNGLNIRS